MIESHCLCICLVPDGLCFVCLQQEREAPSNYGMYFSLNSKLSTSVDFCSCVHIFSFQLYQLSFTIILEHNYLLGWVIFVAVVLMLDHI